MFQNRSRAQALFPGFEVLKAEVERSVDLEVGDKSAPHPGINCLWAFLVSRCYLRHRQEWGHDLTPLPHDHLEFEVVEDQGGH